jgi:hypothetical protein
MWDSRFRILHFIFAFCCMIVVVGAPDLYSFALLDPDRILNPDSGLKISLQLEKGSIKTSLKWSVSYCLYFLLSGEQGTDMK